jgi:hypothetical protein
MVHDDGPVGLEGVRVRFDDERVVSDAGIAVGRHSRRGWALRRLPSVSCGCVATGPGRATWGAR